MRTCAAMGISDPDTKKIVPKITETKNIFKIRNKIIHELDIKLDATRRKRKVRGQDDLISYSDEILKIGKSYIEYLDDIILG